MMERNATQLQQLVVHEVCEVAEFQLTVICPLPSYCISANNLIPSPTSALSAYFVKHYE